MAVNYGLIDVKAFVRSGNTYGTAVDIPGARALSANTEASSETQRGDGTVLAVVTTDRTANGSLEVGTINAAAFAALSGSEIVTVGTGDEQVVHYLQSARLNVPYLQVMGLAPVGSDEGGITQLTIPLLKASNGPSLNFAEELQTPSFDFDLMAWGDPGEEIFYILSEHADDAFVLPAAAMTEVPTAA